MFAHCPNNEELLLFKEAKWDLDIVKRYTYLGVLMGKDITEEDIFSKALKKYENRLSLYSDYILNAPLHFKIMVFNVFLLPIFSYLMQYYIVPKSIQTKIKEAARKACIPFRGGGFGYFFLLAPLGRFGHKLPLRDPWAANMTALIMLCNHEDFIQYHGSDFANLKIQDKPYLDTPDWSSLLIEDHRDAAAYDFLWHYCNKNGTIEVPDVLLVPEDNSSTKLYKLLIEEGFLGDRDSDDSTDPASLANKIRHVWGLLPEASKHVKNTILENAEKVPNWVPYYHRSHQIKLTLNALGTDSRRLMKGLNIDKELRERGDSLPCYICGLPSDSIHHLYLSCEVVKRAREFFLYKLNLPTNVDPLTFTLTYFKVKKKNALLSAAAYIFNFTVWTARGGVPSGGRREPP